MPVLNCTGLENNPQIFCGLNKNVFLMLLVLDTDLIRLNDSRNQNFAAKPTNKHRETDNTNRKCNRKNALERSTVKRLRGLGSGGGGGGGLLMVE